MVTTSHPIEARTIWRSRRPKSSLPNVGVRTQTAPSKISWSAPSTPSCSEPAIGCPGMNRGSSMLRATVVFTLPVSVTMPFVSRRVLRISASRALAGTATKANSASASLPTTSSTPSSNARSARLASISLPVMCHPLARRASEMEPPISPVPTI